MMRSWIMLSLCLLFRGLGYAAESAPPAVVAAESELHALQLRSDSLAVARGAVVRQADDLAGRIAKLRRRGEPSQAEHRALEGYLRDSRSLQEQMDRADADMHELSAQRQELIDRLIDGLQQAIDLTLQQLATAEQAQASALTVRLAELVGQEGAWEAQRRPRYAELAITSPIEAGLMDSPRELRMKGDMLADQDSVLRTNVREIDSRIRSLRDELRVRRKVQELTQDMELFNESEELAGRSAIPPGHAPSVDDGTGRNGVTAEGAHLAGDATGHPFLLPGISQALSGPAPHSLDAIQGWIDILVHYRDATVSRADSLKERSQRFYRQAEEKAK